MAKDWPATEAEIISSGYSDRIAYTKYGPRKTGASIPDVKYRYTVNDKVYTNDQLSITPVDYLNESRVVSLLNHLEDEKTVDIYYNPENPSESVIFRV